MSSPVDNDADRVLAEYPSVLRGRLEALGNRGGFSGARLWKLHTAAGPFCLRASAPAETRTHLRERHRLMRLARGVGLAFVPAILATTVGDTLVEAAGRRWELMEWMPGVADFRDDPSPERLRAAAHALARVHLTWASDTTMSSRCPAIERRLDVTASWRPVASPLNHHLREVVERWLPRVPELLRGAAGPYRVQPCLRDVWHDHLLFEGQRLTGLIDYAAMGEDSVSADLARMLGSLVGDDDTGWGVGLTAYREVAALSSEEEALARRLDRAGVVVALSRWLGWLGEGRRWVDDAGAARRVEELLARVERWRR